MTIYAQEIETLWEFCKKHGKMEAPVHLETSILIWDIVSAVLGRSDSWRWRSAGCMGPNSGFQKRNAKSMKIVYHHVINIVYLRNESYCCIVDSFNDSEMSPFLGAHHFNKTIKHGLGTPGNTWRIELRPRGRWAPHAVQGWGQPQMSDNESCIKRYR